MSKSTDELEDIGREVHALRSQLQQWLDLRTACGLHEDYDIGRAMWSDSEDAATEILSEITDVILGMKAKRSGVLQAARLWEDEDETAINTALDDMGMAP